MSRHKFSEKEKVAVVSRANRLCEYCKHPLDYSHTSFVLEHIFPIAKGGRHELDNLALACDGCNSKKWMHTQNRDPLTGIIVPLFHPRDDDWDEHFFWSEDLSTIQGSTPIGRATVELLMMNRDGIVNLRKMLIATGTHPAQNKIT
ncbi:MAG: HNH endonuclease [Bacteroidetes bacterium]|nr:HNH endonuclease [Bacteroidota bacterium]